MNESLLLYAVCMEHRDQFINHVGANPPNYYSTLIDCGWNPKEESEQDFLVRIRRLGLKNAEYNI